MSRTELAADASWRASKASQEADRAFRAWLSHTFADKGKLDQDADLITLGILDPALQDAVHRFQTAVREYRELMAAEAK
jgi:hypothetical protein